MKTPFKRLAPISEERPAPEHLKRQYQKNAVAVSVYVKSFFVKNKHRLLRRYRLLCTGLITKEVICDDKRRQRQNAGPA